MIFVDRSIATIPEILVSSRAEVARAKIRHLLSSSSPDHLEQLRITFEPMIYLTARPDLFRLFKGKCAYCETGILSNQSGDVEHFRPKQGARSLTAERNQLYYAWLAYDWDNLLIACIDCNRNRSYREGRAGKAEHFPVKGSRAPLMADVATCREFEKPLLLDPCYDRPDEHLSFRSDGSCRSLSDRGETTIEVLGLNVREGLVKARRQAWVEATLLANEFLQMTLSGDMLAPFLLRLRNRVDGTEPYTAVCRAAIRNLWERLRKSGLEIEIGADGLPVIISQGGLEEAVSRGILDEERSSPLEPAPVLPSHMAPNRYPGKEALPAYARERVKRVEIRNFRTLQELDLDIPTETSEEDRRAGALMILGENATGKSTILQAIALALLGTTQIKKLGLRGREFLRRDNDWQLSPAQQATEITVYFEKPGIVQRLKINPRTGEFEGTEAPAMVMLGYGPRRFFAEGKGTRRPRAPSARVKTLIDPTAIITNPSPWLKYCTDSSYNESIAALRKLLALPDEAFVERPAAGHETEGEIMFQLDGNASPLDRLSDGYKTTVAMSVDVMREMLRYWRYLETAQGIVLIDEVETHLHPRWKMWIMRRLRSALPQVQFIATTHDPLTLRGMYDGEVRVLRREVLTDPEGSRVELIKDLPNVQGLSVEQLLTSDLFGLFTTEDPAVEAELIRYVALAAKVNRTTDEEAELERHRAGMARQLRLGDTPARELVQHAVGQYLQQKRSTAPATHERASQAAIDYVVGLDVLPENSASPNWNFPLMIPGSGRGEFHEGIEVHRGADRVRFEAG